jgi:hypothetical protein
LNLNFLYLPFTHWFLGFASLCLSLSLTFGLWNNVSLG